MTTPRRDRYGTTMQQSGDHLDIDKLLGFATAVAQALPVVPMSPEQRSRAQDLITEIEREAGKPAPDHGALRGRGLALRGVLESAGPSAVTSGVLALWRP
jgi:hypothetical protein